MRKSIALLVGAMTACALPAPAEPNLPALVETSDVSGLTLSPDEQWVAFRVERASVSTNTYQSSWYIQPVDASAAPRRIADGGSPIRTDIGVSVNEPAQWSPDGRWLYFRAQIDGEIQVWRARADGGRVEAVTSDDSDVIGFRLSSSGDRLNYQVGASRSEIARAEITEYRDGIRIDGSVFVGQGLFRQSVRNGRLATQRNTGEWFDQQGLLSDRPFRQREVDLKSGTVTDQSRDAGSFQSLPLFSRVPIPGIGEVGLDANSKDLAVFDNSGELEIKCRPTLCTEGQVVNWRHRPGTHEIIFTTLIPERGRAQAIRAWDIQRQTVRTLVEADGLLNGGRLPYDPCAVGHAVGVCVEASAAQLPRLVAIDLTSGKRLVLFEPNQRPASMRGPLPRLLTWKGPSGTTFTGQYFAARGRPGAAPLFITYYVCDGYLRGGLGDEWPLAALAEAGIAALCINEPPTGSRSPTQLPRYELAREAVLSIVENLGRSGAIDKSRIGMGGLSFGSEVAVWIAGHSSALRAISVASPSISPTYYWFHGLQAGTFHENLRQRWGLGAPNETPEAWQRISPVFFQDQIRTPILMQMAEEEYLQAMDYYVPLARRGLPVDLYVYPHEPHIKVQPQHKLAIYRRNLDWFRYWLLDGGTESDGTLGEKEEWNGWQKMRSNWRLSTDTVP